MPSHLDASTILPDPSMDTLDRDVAYGPDAEAMDNVPVYDYDRQTWTRGADHAHYAAETGPLWFCGLGIDACNRAAEHRATS